MTTSKSPIVYLTRREHFSAAHRLWADELSHADNHALFGPCAREHGHGHNYILEVTLRGAVNPVSGIVVNLTEVRDVLKSMILDDVDHRHLNLNSAICQGVNPTAENLVVLFWNILHTHFGPLLYEVRVVETEKNWAVYRGE